MKEPVLAYITAEGETITVRGIKSVVIAQSVVQADRCNIQALSCSIEASGCWAEPLALGEIAPGANVYVLGCHDETRQPSNPSA